MKFEKLKKRLAEDRPSTTVSFSIPDDVIEDLKRLARLRGFSNYEALAKAYIGQGLRTDLERVDSDSVEALVASLRKNGISQEIIDASLKDALTQ